MAQFKNTNISSTGFIALPSGTTGQRPGSPSTGMIRYNTTINDTEYYDGTSWNPISNTGPEATGGTIIDTEIGGESYRIHQFTTVGNSNFTVTKGGEVEVLIVGGGGGGGFGHGGGGGGGAVVYTKSYTVTPQTYTITVGAGGAGNAANNQTNNGGSSSAFSVTATGGGAGGNEDGNNAGNGANGGGGPYNGRAGGTGTAPSVPSGWIVYAGNNGGAGQPGSGVPYGCGGGGGAGQVGITANNNMGQGHGGAGVSSNIFGHLVHFGGGGGGVIYTGTAYAGDGGLGGGGGGAAVQPGYAGRGDVAHFGPARDGIAAGNDIGLGGNAAPNSGGGGGGGANENVRGGDGGTGVVIIKYKKNSTTINAPTIILKNINPSHSSFTPESPAPSAAVITDLGLGSGWYWVDLGSPQKVYVDTQYDGGGWYLIMVNNAGNGGLNNLSYSDATGYKQIFRPINSILPSGSRYPEELPGYDLAFFNLWTGMRLWEQMTGGPGTGGEIVQTVATHASPLSGTYTKRANWFYTGFGTLWNFQGASMGTTTSDNPGFYAYHAANGYNLTTYDRDQDVYGSNCSNLYNNNPWWYGACWSGNYFAGGSGYTDAPYWFSSGPDFHNFGSVYVRPN